MSNVLITIATPEIADHAALFIENHRGYAAKTGYEFRFVTDAHWKHVHPSYSKVYEIDRALKDGAEVVIWADADVAFMDWSIDLASLLKPDYFMAAYQQQNWHRWKYLCAGLTVWKNTGPCRAFVDEWVKRCTAEKTQDRPWEQWYMDELVRETNYAGIRPCNAAEIGCFAPEIWHDSVIWQPGMPTVHLAGPATWERRAEVFKSAYAPQVKT